MQEGEAKGTELTRRAALQKPGVSLVPGVCPGVPGGLFVRGAVRARVLCGRSLGLHPSDPRLWGL